MTRSGQPEVRAAFSGQTCVFTLNDDPVLRCSAAVRLTDGRVLSTGSPDARVLRWTIERVDACCFVLRLAYTNPSQAPIGVEQLLPLVSERGFRCLSVKDLLLSETGWQSWTRAHPLRPFYDNTATAPPPIRAPILPHREPGSQAVGWMSVLRGPRDDRVCLLGFVSGRDQTCVLEVAPRTAGHMLRASAEVEGALVEPGATLVSEPLLVAFGEEAQVVRRYADMVAQQSGARVPTHTPTGWCSWYEFFTQVTEGDVLRNLSLVDGARELLPLDLIQLDDGYQAEVGDWLELRPTFPSGIRALSDAVHGRGYALGIWLAPFLLSARSSAFAQHPDWVVRDESGQPVVAIENWGSANYALDTTHPAAYDWLEHVLRTMCEEWRIDYLKIDFAYAAALRGQRFDRKRTGAQAYCHGMELIRAVAGERFVLGCGAPLVSSVGLVDGMRIGSDVAPHWKPPTGEAVGPSTFNALRATLARTWPDRRWWLNDPDCVLVREDHTQLTPEEVRAWASVVALSGGMLLVGDDLSRLSPERRQLLSRLFPPHAEHRLHVLPPLVDDAPERACLRVSRPWATWTIVAIANWTDSPAPKVFDASAWGLEPGQYHLFDLWTGAHSVSSAGSTSVGWLAPHELRLLSVHPVLSRPAVIGSTGHVLGDAMDVVDEHWDAGVLHVKLANRRAHRGWLCVAVPARWRYRPQPEDAPGVLCEDGLLRVPIDLHDPLPLELRFEVDST